MKKETEENRGRRRRRRRRRRNRGVSSCLSFWTSHNASPSIHSRLDELPLFSCIHPQESEVSEEIAHQCNSCFLFHPSFFNLQRFINDGFFFLFVSVFCRVPAVSIIRAGATAEKLSFRIPPPVHPTYDLKAIIKESLREDTGGIGTHNLCLYLYNHVYMHILLCISINPYVYV